ncbi:MAG: phospholipase [Acidobacteria bacterium]|nr:MAG: phospholipase [Acidobacteriota bacterium]
MRPGGLTVAHKYSRRQFLEQAALAGGALALGGGAALAAKPSAGLPHPKHSGIEHVVVLTMENRSFDHLLGWLPGADGRQAGLTYVDSNGVPHTTYPLAPDYQGCGHPDPDHSYSGGRVEYDNGACDLPPNDVYPIGYYDADDLAFLAKAAPGWTAFDRYFAGILGPTFPNRFYMHAAQTDRLSNTFELSTLPTIWDRLAAAGLTGRYYFSDAPFLGLWGPKYFPISRTIDHFFDDCASGTLPQVSYVDPSFLGEEAGTSTDDHPHADIRNGEVFMNTIYQAVTSSPDWKHTVLVITYDEWGGFFEHVPPPTAPIPPASAAAGDTDGRLGFRVPALVISPYAERGAISHDVFDHTSILRMIEWRWGLPPLTVRDETAANLALTLDFNKPNRTAPVYAIAPGPYGAPCPNTTTSSAAVPEENEWIAVRALAQSYGWNIP